MIKAKLSNGLNLIYKQNKAVDVVSIQYWVYCGSAYEAPKEYGLSHFIEHLMFKGSKKYTEHEIAGTLEFLGGELNAFTSKEQTCYYVTLPKENYQKGLEILSDMVFNPLFNKDAIDSERGVVVEEINRSKDNPYSEMGRLFNEGAFKGHAYAHPVLGYKNIIETVSKEEIVDYQKRHYVPKRMMLSVTGNIDFETLKYDLETILNETVEQKTISKPNDGISELNPTNNVQILSKHMPINNIFLSFGFNIPNVYHRDIPALDVLSAILGEGDSSRLTRELRLIEPIVSAINCSSYTPKHAGTFMFTVALEGNNEAKTRLKKAFNIMKGILLDLKKNITETEITKAKTIFISEKAYEMETANGYGRKLGLMFHLKDDLSFEDSYFEELQKLTKNDIIRVLDKYILSQKISTFSAVLPQKNFNIDELKELFDKEFIAYTKAFPYKLEKDQNPISVPLFKKPKDIITKEPKKIDYKGAKLILRKVNSTPLIASRLVFEGGSRIETETTQGIGRLLARSLFMGNKSQSTQDIANLIDKTASTVNASSAKNSFIISSLSLKNYSKIIQKIIKDTIAYPSFEEPFFSSEKHVIKEAIKSREDTLSSYTRFLLTKLLFQTHPYRFDSLGNVETVSSFTQQDLTEHKNKIFRKENLIMSIVGDYNEEESLIWFKEIVDSLESKKVNFNIEQELEQISPRYLTKVKESTQTNIAIAYKTVKANSEETPILDVLSAIMSGQSGRLFINLREKYSLAYVVAPFALSGFDPGYFGIYTACDDSKTKLAVDKIREEFEKLKTEEVSDLELERAKNYIIGNKAIDTQKYHSQALRYALDELLEIGYNSSKTEFAKIMAVSKEDILKLANKYFIPKRENLVIVSKTDYKDTFKQV